MPFFMYLGGFVFFHIGDALHPRPSYGAYLIRRAERLLLPFLSLGLLILLGKFVAERFLYVDNTPASFWVGLQSLFWNTEQSLQCRYDTFWCCSFIAGLRLSC